MLVATDEELAVVDGRGGIGFFRDFVLGDDFVFFAGFDDGHVAFVREEVGEAVCGKQGGTVVTGKTFHPMPFSGLRVEATGDAIVSHNQEVGADGDG